MAKSLASIIAIATALFSLNAHCSIPNPTDINMLKKYFNPALVIDINFQNYSSLSQIPDELIEMKRKDRIPIEYAPDFEKNKQKTK